MHGESSTRTVAPRLSAAAKYSATIDWGSRALSGSTACLIALRFPPTVVPSTASRALRLRHRRNEPLDVFWARQAMVAILYERQHDVVASKARGQIQRVLP